MNRNILKALALHSNPLLRAACRASKAADGAFAKCYRSVKPFLWTPTLWKFPRVNGNQNAPGFIVTNDSKARNSQAHTDGSELSSSLQNIFSNSLHFHTPSHARQLTKNHYFQENSCTETHAQFWCKNTSFHIKLKNPQKPDQQRKKKTNNQNKLQMKRATEYLVLYSSEKKGLDHHGTSHSHLMCGMNGSTMEKQIKPPSLLAIILHLPTQAVTNE